MLITALLLTVMLQATCCHILRDPECLYHANFTVIMAGKYLDAPIMESLSIESAQLCGIACVTTNYCASFNYNSVKTLCHLLNVTLGTVKDDASWKFHTTDYSDSKNRGGKCKSLKPCPDNTICFDSCSSSGYTCAPLKEIAQGKTASAINYYANNRKPEKAVDGLPYSDPAIAYSCYVSKNVANPWFLLDLGDIFQTEIIRIVNEDHCPTCASRMFHMYITIGTTDDNPKNNPSCVEDAYQANIEKVDYSCSRSTMKGRYIYVYLKRTTLLAICEIQVYTF